MHPRIQVKLDDSLSPGYMECMGFMTADEHSLDIFHD